MNQEITFNKPQSIEDAIKILSEADKPMIVAGGTDFVVKFKNNMFPDITDFVDILDLNLNEIKITNEKIIIGSTCKMMDIVESKELNSFFPTLTNAASKVGALQIRNMATIGGNIANASPAGDTIPALLSLDAEVNIQGPSGTKKIHLADFFAGRPGKTCLKQGEIITSFELPKRETKGSFVKLGERKAHAISKINLALTVWNKNDKQMNCRIAIGSVAPVVLRCPEAEAVISNATWPVSDAIINEAAAHVGNTAKPIDDVRSTAAYRKKMASELLKKAISEITK